MASNRTLDIMRYLARLAPKIKQLTVNQENYANIAKYPSKKGGVNNYVDIFNIYPHFYCGNIRKKYIFDDLIKI